MVDNLIKGVIAGVLTYVWYYVGTAVPFTSEGSFAVVWTAAGDTYSIPSLGYWFFTFLAFATARGGK